MRPAKQKGHLIAFNDVGIADNNNFISFDIYPPQQNIVKHDMSRRGGKKEWAATGTEIRENERKRQRRDREDQWR